ncbi:unnamed protein product, partial [Amoebophrya sp. A25]|eukprot:GSA25T00002396001.1
MGRFGESQSAYMEIYQFHTRLEKALDAAKLVLNEAREPCFLADAPHSFADTFRLAETWTNAALVSVLNALCELRAMGCVEEEFDDKNKRDGDLKNPGAGSGRESDAVVNGGQDNGDHGMNRGKATTSAGQGPLDVEKILAQLCALQEQGSNTTLTLSSASATGEQQKASKVVLRFRRAMSCSYLRKEKREEESASKTKIVQ